MGDVLDFKKTEKIEAQKEEVAEKKGDVSTRNTALTATEGGLLGEEVGEVKKRQTLLGN